MPMLVGALLGGLLQILGSVLGRILVALGIGFVAYSGIDTSIQWALDYVKDSFTGLPVFVVQVCGLMQIDTCISIMFSAFLAKITINGVGSAAKMVIKK